MRRLGLAALATLVACKVPDSPPPPVPVRLEVWRDDGGLRAGLVANDPDGGLAGPDASQDRLVRSSPSRKRDVGLCSPDHFCWENPLPQGNDLKGVWASPEGEVFAVGVMGTVLRYDGKAWTRAPVATSLSFEAVWGVAKDLVFAIGPKAMLEWDGRDWKKELPLEGATSFIWGKAADDLWAAGEAVAHFDGQSWSVAVPAGDFEVVALTGTARNDVWALARGEKRAQVAKAAAGVLFRFDGKSWTRSKLPFVFGTAALLALSPSDAWIATDFGEVGRFDGKSWKKVVAGGTQGEKPVILPLEQGGLMVAGAKRKMMRFMSNAWLKEEKEGLALRAVYSAGLKDGWGVGDRGVVGRWDSVIWQRVMGAADSNLRAVHGSALDNLWAAGERGTVLRRAENGEWWRVPVPGSFTGRFNGVWVAGLNDVWVAGDGELAHFDGRDLTSKYETSMGQLKAVWGLGPERVWVAGDQGIFHFNGKVWKRVDVPATYTMSALTASADGSLWALGDGGMVRFDGTQWAEIGASKEHAPSVLFTGPAGPYVAGEQGVWRWDGKATWASVLSRSESLAGYAAAADDVWALGKGEDVRQWNGVGWRKLATGAGPQPRAAWSRNGEVFVVGDAGAILHCRP